MPILNISPAYVSVVDMGETQTISLIRDTLHLLLDGEPPSTEQLAEALDRLMAALHASPAGDVAETAAELPHQPYDERYFALKRRFPDFGLYAIADPSDLSLATPMTGDAIDDLADISTNLEEVLWRAEHIGIEDALWHFRFLYQTHWGQHLRELALYLHAKIYA
ncbi:DUF5063 domain-containing protein [Aestuariivirga sp.]|uniref:DUF5063 domain-containing protein n=1 Tax=Aestuariivirga sp. TaxID=2650926 RepID=UPI0039E6B8BB